MADKRAQINFRVTEAFQKQLESQCLLRGISQQELITDACEYFFLLPVHSRMDSSVDRQSAFLDLCRAFINTVSPEQILVYETAMRETLRDFRSSRRRKQ